jgi:hypothetical protein
LPLEGCHRLLRRPQALPLQPLTRGTSSFSHPSGSSRRARSARPLELLRILPERPQRHARSGGTSTGRIALTRLVLEPMGAESGELTEVRLGGRRTGGRSREGKLMPRWDTGCHGIAEVAEVGRDARARVLTIWRSQLDGPELHPKAANLAVPSGWGRGLRTRVRRMLREALHAQRPPPPICSGVSACDMQTS